MIDPYVEAGVTTGELDAICHRYIVDEQQAIPAPLHYRGFPKSICTSVNHEVCHGIPGDRRLRNGDVINIDVTVIKDGYHGDTSRMFFVGKPPVIAERVTRISRECLWRAIGLVRPGVRLGDLGHTIQQHAERNNCSVVREFCGHGIGRVFHEDPQVLHYGTPGTGVRIRSGDDVHHRADDQRGPAAREGSPGRMDGDHPRPAPVRSVGTHIHPSPRTAAKSLRSSAAGGDDRRRSLRLGGGRRPARRPRPPRKRASSPVRCGSAGRRDRRRAGGSGGRRLADGLERPRASGRRRRRPGRGRRLRPGRASSRLGRRPAGAGRRGARGRPRPPRLGPPASSPSSRLAWDLGDRDRTFGPQHPRSAPRKPGATSP